jgi:hypothetical protein
MIWVGLFFLIGGIGMIVNPGAIATGRRRGDSKLTVVGKGILCALVGAIIMGLS